MNRPHKPSESDSELFQNAMEREGVAPLGECARITSSRPARPGVQMSRQAEDDMRALAESLAMSPDASPHEIEENENLQKPGKMTRQEFVKLKKGKFSRQDYVDLHGLTVEEARKHLLQFIDESVQDHKFCVRVVHGKGKNSYDGVPKLKHMTHLLLGRNRHVRGYSRALANDGGSGATYVLLGKK